MHSGPSKSLCSGTQNARWSSPTVPASSSDLMKFIGTASSAEPLTCIAT